MKEAFVLLDKHIRHTAIEGKKTMVHVKYAQMLSNYGLILREKGELSEARDILEKALEWQVSCLAENSIMTIRTLYNLGTVYHRLGLRDESESKIKTALDLVNSVDRKHPYKATIATGMAHLMVDCSEPHRAEPQLKEAVNIRSNVTKCCGETHHKVGFAFKSLGDIARSKGQVISARDYYMKAYSVYIRLIEREGRQKDDYKPEVYLGHQISFVEDWKEDCAEVEKLLKLRDDVQR